MVNGEYIYGNIIYHFKDSLIHKEDGPAIIAPNDINKWFLYGKEYSYSDMPLSLFIAYCKWKYKNEIL